MTDSPLPTILFVHSSDELYGADRVLLEIVRCLPGRYQAVVALPSDVDYGGDLSRELAAAGADVRRIDMAVLRRSYLSPSQFPRLLWRLIRGSILLGQLARREQVELVHTNTVAALCGPLAALLAHRRHVWDIHENLLDEPRLLAFALRAAVWFAPGIVLANSRSSARSIVDGNRRRAQKTRVVYYGVNDDPQAHLTPDPVATGSAELRRISFIGRLTPRKGIDQAIGAIAILRREGISIPLDVFGSVPPGQIADRDQYVRRARELRIDDLVRFHGFVRDARQRLRAGDIQLVPSQRPEPFGMVLVEGMLAQQVVIACRNGGGSDEILDDGVTGLYCDRDSEAIAAAIKSVLCDAGRRAEIGRAALDSARTRFSLERFRSEMLDI